LMIPNTGSIPILPNSFLCTTHTLRGHLVCGMIFEGMKSVKEIRMKCFQV